MTIFPHDCPHCGTKNSGFEIKDSYVLDQNSTVAWFMKCTNPTCCGPAIAIGQAITSGTAPYRERLQAFYPQSAKPDIPEHMPENVERYYLQAENIALGHPDAAGAMYRKALDVGLKIRFPEETGLLAHRLKKLVETGSLTRELGDFAHHVRLGGNDAAHDEDPFTEDEAKELGFLTKMVMTYLYTLPEMIRLRQERIDAEKASGTEEQ